MSASVEPSSRIYKPGEEVKLGIKASTWEKPSDITAVRVNVGEPCRKQIPPHAQVLLVRDGTASVSSPLALDEPIGKHTVSVMEVIGGNKEPQRVFPSALAGWSHPGSNPSSVEEKEG